MYESIFKMKIVDRATFLAMPAETVYAKYEPCIFEALCIKGDTLYESDGKPIDWFYQQIAEAIAAHDSGEWGGLLEESRLTGRSLNMNFECQGRDGCFEDEQLFAVFDKLDIAALIGRLRRCL
jgi:hypothetical protein